MDEEIMMCRPCKYDRFSPCECCGKCNSGYDYEDEDPDREYEEARDEGRWLTT